MKKIIIIALLSIVYSQLYSQLYFDAYIPLIPDIEFELEEILPDEDTGISDNISFLQQLKLSDTERKINKQITDQQLAEKLYAIFLQDKQKKSVDKKTDEKLIN